MRFTLVGTGTTVPAADRGPAGFLVEEGGARVLVDGGTGTVQRLARLGVDARDLDGGVFSHLHVDHSGDLVPILFTMRVGIDRIRERDYPLWGGEGLATFVERLKELYPNWLVSKRYTVPVTELSLSGAGRAELPGGVLLETLPAKHGASALHLRFTGRDGFTVVFSGDTGWSDNLVTLARGADVLVCECAMREAGLYDEHLCPDEVAAIVDAARPRRTVLTHLYPDVDVESALARVRSTGCPVERGSDGQVLTP
jgi:ribonuclease BN (tRNA processing enzyme)